MNEELNLLFWSNPLVDAFNNSIKGSENNTKKIENLKEFSSSGVKNDYKSFNQNKFFNITNKNFSENKSFTNNMPESKTESMIKETNNFNEKNFINNSKEFEKTLVNEKSYSVNQNSSNEKNNYFSNSENEKIIEKEKASEIRSDVYKEKLQKNLTDIKVDMSGMKNSINSEMDIDSVIKKLTEKIENSLLTSAEGVHSSV